MLVFVILLVLRLIQLSSEGPPRYGSKDAATIVIEDNDDWQHVHTVDGQKPALYPICINLLQLTYSHGMVYSHIFAA